MAELVLDMPKKNRRAEPEKKPDQHTSDFMIRLPPEYRKVLQTIQKKEGRPMTITVQMALERYFRDVGADFTPNWPEAL